MADRIPLNSKYCRKVKCPLRSGSKCTVPECARNGAEKWPMYFTEHGHLADGDIVDGP